MKPGALVVMATLLALSSTSSGATAGLAVRIGEAQATGSGKPDSPNPGSASRPSHALLSRGFLLGRWTDDSDCTNAIELRQDGTFTTATGAQGLWNLDDDRLTMSGRNTLTIRIVVIDQNRITVINPDGSLGRSTRC